MNTQPKQSWPEWLIWVFFDLIPYKIDSRVRRLDRSLFRTDVQKKKWLQLFQPTGHSIILQLLFVTTVYFVIVGPTFDMLLNEFLHPFVIWFVAFLLVTVLGRKFPRHIYLMQFLTLLFVVAWILMVALVIDPSNKESDGRLYTHIYLGLSLVIMVWPLAARWGLMLLFRSLDVPAINQIFADRFRNIELFEDRDSKPEEKNVGFNLDRVVNSLMLALFYNPILLLLLPSVLVLLTQERHELAASFGLGLGVSFLLLLYGRLRERWHMLVELIERATTSGVPLVLSVVVILLAVGRLVDFSYISIFLDGTRLTVWGYLFAFYSFAWIFEYWINRFLNETLIGIFSVRSKPGDYRFDYVFEAVNVLDLKPDQHLKRERTFQIHGGSRFLVQSKDKKWFHSYTRHALIERLLSVAADQKTSINNKKLINAFKRKIRIYFFSLNLIMLATLVVFVFSQKTTSVAPLYDNKPQPLSTLAGQSCEQSENELYRLDCAIINFSATHGDGVDNNSALLITASGGGTRAALHTASVLYGLQQQNLTDNIILMSGVSGGGVSSAYFSHHYDSLVNNSPAENCDPEFPRKQVNGVDPLRDYAVWRCYFSAMSHHYIKDVVEGMAEWRILGKESNGRLLQESLVSRFSMLEPSGSSITQENFATLNSHGLILNTTITGHRFQESQELSRLYASVSEEEANSHYFTIFQGGRLALTNIVGAANLRFSSYGSSEDLALKYRAFNFPDMALTTAAAMTANFPPVFSDARLCLAKNCEPITSRNMSSDYFVTDGGATHNQGLISLFEATKAAVNNIPTCAAPSVQPLPRLQILVAEASFANFDYSEGGRGLGAALSSSYGLGNGVVGQQFEALKDLYDAKFKSCNGIDDVALQAAPSIQVHMLPLPRLFRSRGGMGTHWMMPTNIQVAFPDQIDADKARKVELDREQLEYYFASAYSHHRSMCKSNDDSELDPEFEALCDALKIDGSLPLGTAATPTCTPWLRFNRSVGLGPLCLDSEGLNSPSSPN